jgi:hypothetical protein
MALSFTKDKIRNIFSLRDKKNLIWMQDMEYDNFSANVFIECEKKVFLPNIIFW